MSTLEKVLLTYTPTLPTENWMSIRPFVLRTIRANFGPHSDERAVRRGLVALIGFADWVLTSGVGELDDAAKHSNVIDAYTAYRKHEVEPAVAERERKQLRTLAGIPNSPEPDRTPTTAPPSQPYTRDEQDEIRRWANGQSTEQNRRTARAVAALSLGCGLTAIELMQVRGCDLHVLEDGLMGVVVAGRTVPVLKEWEEELRSLADGDAGEYVVRPSRRRTGLGCLKAIAQLGYPTPSTQRMRATWLLAHVNAGTHIPTLIEASGLTSSDFLRRVLPFADTWSAAARTATLRLGTEAGR
jgi:hypothetical protein